MQTRLVGVDALAVYIGIESGVIVIGISTESGRLRKWKD
jgi:hypothetical protein